MNDKPTRILCDYDTGEDIRPATQEETRRSDEAAKQAPYTGVIDIDGRRVYVEAMTRDPLQ